MRQKIQELFKLFNWIPEKKGWKQHWFDIDERIRFVLIGGVNMGLRYVFFAGLVWSLSEAHYQVLLGLTWGISTIWAFYSYKYLVFQSEGSHFSEYLKSVAVWCVSYVLNAGLLELLVEIAGVNIYLSQAAAVMVIVVINYLLFKHFAFRQKPKPLSRWERMVQFFDVLK